MRLRQKQDGFTIIELLIVIIIIGVLTAFIVTTFADFRQKERNQERQKDIKALQVGIEGYYAQNGKYPTLKELNDTAWRTKNIKALETDDFKDPSNSSDKLVAAPAASVYSYDVKADDGSACDNSAKDCAKYTLTATYEGGEKFEKTSLD
jgi:prepilin-type N-terminal cleavage/methylation domain-containing protein